MVEAAMANAWAIRSSDMPLKGIMGNWPPSPAVEELLALPCALALMLWFVLGPRAMRPTDHGPKSLKIGAKRNPLS